MIGARELRPPQGSGAAVAMPHGTFLVRVIARLGWGVVDQVVSSATNFALGVLVARIASMAELGAFGVAYGTYTIALGITRALSSQVFVVRFSGASPDDARRAEAVASGGTVAVAGIISAAMFLGSGAVSSEVAYLLRALAIFFPMLALQDFWRFAFLASRQGVRASVNDAIWGILLVVLLVVPLPGSGPRQVFLLWCVAGSIAGLIALVHGGVLPHLASARAWLREQADLGVRYVGEFLASVCGTAVSIFGVAAIAGMAGAGAIRGGQMLVAPVTVLFTGLSLAGVPEAVRFLRAREAILPKVVAIVSAAMVLVPLVWCFGIALMPDRWGSALLGESWSSSRALIVPLSLAMAGTAASVGTTIGLRAMAAASHSLRARLWTAPLTLALVASGAAIAGSRGAAWGLAGSGVLSACVWALYFRKAFAERLSLHGRSETKT